jgi:hypothetical protein
MSDKDPQPENEGSAWSTFDETNGVVSGLEGESGGTAEGENYSAHDPEDPERHGLGNFLRHPFGGMGRGDNEN